MNKMKILLTNDDGYYSDGINSLYKELKKKHNVFIVAPDREQSASSHSLTLNRPLRAHRINRQFYTTDGTPTDCIMLAIHLFFKDKNPDMIISGINHGPNMGDDVTYSGTVAAAIEGSILRIPSIAVSMSDYEPGMRMSRAAVFVRKLVESYDTMNLQPSTFLNINIPYNNYKVYKEYEFTKLGFRFYKDIIINKTDPRGKPYFWIGGRPQWKSTKGTDFETVKRGVISITPLKVNLTDTDTLKRVSGLKLKLS